MSDRQRAAHQQSVNDGTPKRPGKQCSRATGQAAPDARPAAPPQWLWRQRLESNAQQGGDGKAGHPMLLSGAKPHCGEASKLLKVFAGNLTYLAGRRRARRVTGARLPRAARNRVHGGDLRARALL
jgi:hypothetical protein